MSVDWSLEAEKLVLGQVVEHSADAPRVVDLLADRLTADDFGLAEHRAVYGAVAELLEDGEPVTLPHVLQRLSGERRTPRLAEALGLIVDHTYPRLSDRTLLGQVRLIRSASRARMTRELGLQITAAANADDGDRVLNDAYERMLRLATQERSTRPTTKGRASSRRRSDSSVSA